MLVSTGLNLQGRIHSMHMVSRIETCFRLHSFGPIIITAPRFTVLETKSRCIMFGETMQAT